MKSTKSGKDRLVRETQSLKQAENLRKLSDGCQSGNLDVVKECFPLGMYHSLDIPVVHLQKGWGVSTWGWKDENVMEL